MNLEQQKIDEIVALVHKRFPNWQGFSDADFMEDEVNYKQETIAKARKALEGGDLASAITSMEALDGEAATLIAPWLDKAKATQAAQQLKSTLDGILSARKAGAVNFTGAGSSGVVRKTVGDSSAYTAGGGM